MRKNTNYHFIVGKLHFFKGHRQTDLSDTSPLIPVTLQVLRSALVVEWNKPSEKSGEDTDEKVKKHVIRYTDIDSLVELPTGFLINTKVKITQLNFK